MRNLVVMGAVSVVVAMTQVSCNGGAECGKGTVLINGSCEIAIQPDMSCRGLCGPNTTYDPTLLQCVGEASVVCDSATTSEVTDEITGVTTCVGEAGCGPYQCANPGPGKVSVCGQLLDIETSARLDLGGGGLCDFNNPADDGPCSLDLAFYDALAFAQDPTGSAELPYDSLRVNECGYFAVEGIPEPPFGYLGIGVDDADATDDHVLAGVAIAATSGVKINDLNVYVARQSTIDMWTDSAGMPFGSQDFAQHGVYVPIYLHCDQPVPGVTVISSGSPQPASDYYFSDLDPALRTTVNPSLASTGDNGSGLLVDVDLAPHTGSGGDIGACEWDRPLAAAIPGVVFAQEIHSVDPATSAVCTCP